MRGVGGVFLKGKNGVGLLVLRYICYIYIYIYIVCLFLYGISLCYMYMIFVHHIYVCDICTVCMVYSNPK